jgi:hypothetical protein
MNMYGTYLMGWVCYFVSFSILTDFSLLVLDTVVTMTYYGYILVIGRLVW